MSPVRQTVSLGKQYPVNGLGSMYKINDNEFMAPSLSCYLFLQEKYCYIKSQCLNRKNVK
jgi:hypothetical protein